MDLKRGQSYVIGTLELLNDREPKMVQTVLHTVHQGEPGLVGLTRELTVTRKSEGQKGKFSGIMFFLDKIYRTVQASYIL